MVDYQKPVRLARGYGNDVEQQEIYPDSNGIINIVVKELELVTIQLADDGPQKDLTGYMLVGNQLKSLPIGSTLDAGTATFYWQPAPGFFGQYELVFIEKNQNEELKKMHFRIIINPQY